MLKPQDILIALKIQILFSQYEKEFLEIDVNAVEFNLTKETTAEWWSQRLLAQELKLSLSEINSGLNRLEQSGLARPFSVFNLRIPRVKALEEFLIHGLKYVWPVQLGEITRGMPTGYAAEPLKSHFVSGEEELVPIWPDPEGTVRGYSFQPLYRSAPFAARKDERLYQALALVDAIRGGRARERALAIEMLKQWLGGKPFKDISSES